MCSDLEPSFVAKVEGYCTPFKSICEYIFFPLGSILVRLNLPNDCLCVKGVQWPWTKFLCQGKVSADLKKKIIVLTIISVLGLICLLQPTECLKKDKLYLS